jgi:1,4-alpha-glucan branching enzyme
MKETEITTEEPRERTVGNALSDRCAKARMTYLLRLTGYGEKETQMGEELGEETGEHTPGEHADGVAWGRLERLPVATLQRTVAELNHWYLSTPALWNNTDGAGHYRLLCEDGEKTAFCRRGRNGDEVTVLCNRGDTPLQNFLLQVLADGTYREAVNTDASRFGGSGVTNGAILSAERTADGGGFGVRVSLAPHSALALVRD